ncbi:hypothetical protein AB205_0004560, partial [Aquarana catesbeiana]
TALTVRVRSPGMAGIVQYVVLRKDLQAGLGWPLGALVAQACHAATAAIHLHYDHPHTREMPVPDEVTLTGLAETLKQANIDHKLWTEQPENIPTCIALRPYRKEEVHPYLKRFKLLK